MVNNILSYLIVILIDSYIYGIIYMNAELNNHHRNLIFSEKEQFLFEKFVSLKENLSIDMRELEQIVHDIRECVVKVNS